MTDDEFHDECILRAFSALAPAMADELINTSVDERLYKTERLAEAAIALADYMSIVRDEAVDARMLARER
jgi:hypothetical protein